jgi:hypothetical protein
MQEMAQPHALERLGDGGIGCAGIDAEKSVPLFVPLYAIAHLGDKLRLIVAFRMDDVTVAVGQQLKGYRVDPVPVIRVILSGIEPRPSFCGCTKPVIEFLAVAVRAIAAAGNFRHGGFRGKNGGLRSIVGPDPFAVSVCSGYGIQWAVTAYPGGRLWQPSPRQHAS